jgi:hypothetical protein
LPGLQVPIEFLSFTIVVVQPPFTALTTLFNKKRNLLKARVIIYAHNHQ